MKQVTLWQCYHCGTQYSDKKSCELCESTHKTFDPSSRQMLDLCNECKYRMLAQINNREYRAVKWDG